MIEIVRTSDVVLLGFLQSLLENAKIPFFVADQHISAMEGMEFDTPKGKMIFRKEDHQALQSMYHFKIKVDPKLAWAVNEPIREIKIEDMNVPIRNKR